MENFFLIVFIFWRAQWHHLNTADLHISSPCLRARGWRSSGVRLSVTGQNQNTGKGQVNICQAHQILPLCGQGHSYTAQFGGLSKKKTQSKIKTDCAFQVEKWILRVLLFRVKLNKTKAEHSATADHWKLCLHGKGHRAAHPTEHLLFFQPPYKTNWKWKLSHIKENSGLVPFLDKSTTSIFLNHKFTKKNPLFYEEVLFWQEILVKDSMV